MNNQFESFCGQELAETPARLSLNHPDIQRVTEGTKAECIERLSQYPIPYDKDNHPTPPQCLEVPSLEKSGTMIITPLCVGNFDAADSITNAIDTAIISENRSDFSAALSLCLEFIPTFFTQFDREQMSKIMEGDTYSLINIKKEVLRAYAASSVENILIPKINDSLTHATQENILEKIEDSHVREGINQAMSTWKDIMCSPYRNFYALSKASSGIQENDDSLLFQGNKLAALGPSHISICNLETRSNDGVWQPDRRILRCSNNLESFIEYAVVVLHELIHVCQSNAILAKGIDVREKHLAAFISCQSNIQATWGKSIVSIEDEGEAWWVSICLMVAYFQASDLSVEEFSIKHNMSKRWSNNLQKACSLYQEHKDKPRVKGQIYPEGFDSFVGKLYQNMGKIMVTQTGDFEWSPVQY